MHRLTLVLALFVCLPEAAFGQEQNTDLAAGETVALQLPRPFVELPASADVPVAATSRPGALAGLYASLGALNVLDVYSTNHALKNGAREVNPIVRSTAGNISATIALKAAATATSICFAEKLWKKNRGAAIATMVIVNGATAAVVARNFRNAR